MMHHALLHKARVGSIPNPANQVQEFKVFAYSDPSAGGGSSTPRRFKTPSWPSMPLR